MPKGVICIYIHSCLSKSCIDSRIYSSPNPGDSTNTCIENNAFDNFPKCSRKNYSNALTLYAKTYVLYSSKIRPPRNSMLWSFAPLCSHGNGFTFTIFKT